MALSEQSMTTIYEALATLKYLQWRKATWDKNELRILMDLAGKLTHAEIGKLLGRSAMAVKVKLHKIKSGRHRLPWETAPVEAQPVPVEALEYVVMHYLLSSSSTPLGDRKVYSQNMFKVREWLDTLQQRPAAEAGA